MWSPEGVLFVLPALASAAPGLLGVGEPMVLLLTAVASACVALGVAFVLIRWAQESSRGQVGAGADTVPDASNAKPVPVTTCELAATRICCALDAWLEESQDRQDLWISFDQLVRELLTEHLGATRIRCYHVRPGCDTLQAVHATGDGDSAQGPSARDGLLGHVATSGQEFAVNDPGHGPLLDRLAGGTDDDWAWIWPVRAQHMTIGVLAVGKLDDPSVLTSGLRSVIKQLVSVAWQHVVCLEQLRVATRTDPASGVLTRNDFLALAGHALADSYRANEPVVVAVLVLEGMRRLDDAGRWQQRDTLIEQLAQLLSHRVRSDDLVGRFSDDRFVVLLRRLDSGLGRLIAEKTLAAAQDLLRQFEASSHTIRLRFGLAGSGFSQPPLERLLAAAFDSAQRARERGVPVESDLESQAVEARTR